MPTMLSGTNSVGMAKIPLSRCGGWASQLGLWRALFLGSDAAYFATRKGLMMDSDYIQQQRPGHRPHCGRGTA
jgi:hypothetical protein